MHGSQFLQVTTEMAPSCLLQVLLALSLLASSVASNSKLFREYIGAEFTGVTFSDVPINDAVDFHFILAFAIDYPADGDGTAPTNGEFNPFWDTDNLSADQVAAIKQSHPNVKVMLSVGGDSVQGGAKAYFSPSSVDSWVSNAVSSLTSIIQEYNLDGVDIDYEHFSADEDTFAECIGQLLTTLKDNGIISFASIAPYDDDEIQRYYQALWNGYGDVIDYVNFQFYGYPNSTTVSEFLSYFQEQSSNYDGGKVLVSISTDEPCCGDGGLSPENGFFTACSTLKEQGELNGIFIWTADTSIKNGFIYETQAQDLLAS